MELTEVRRHNMKGLIQHVFKNATHLFEIDGYCLRQTAAGSVSLSLNGAISDFLEFECTPIHSIFS